MSVNYRWKTGYSITGINPTAAATELMRIQSANGVITPDIVVAEAQDINNPLHSAFEWVENKAAHEYRKTQAQLLLRKIEVVITQPNNQVPIKIRAFQSVVLNDQPQYITVNQAVKDPQAWSQVKDQALKEVQQWQNKYKHITEFEKIHQAIKQVAGGAP